MQMLSSLFFAGMEIMAVYKFGSRVSAFFTVRLFPLEMSYVWLIHVQNEIKTNYYISPPTLTTLMHVHVLLKPRNYILK